MIKFIDIGIEAHVGDFASTAIMQHRGRGDRHFGRAGRVGLQEAEVLDHRVTGKFDLAGHAWCLRPGLHAGKLDALIGIDNADTVQLAEKIKMPPGAAEFAIGDGLQANVFLLFDQRPNFRVLNLPERCRIDLALFALCAGELEGGCPQQQSDMISAERRIDFVAQDSAFGRLGNKLMFFWKTGRVSNLFEGK